MFLHYENERNKASAKYMFFHPFSLENVFLFNFFFIICKCVNKIFLALHNISFYFLFYSLFFFNFNKYFIQHLLMTGSLL